MTDQPIRRQAGSEATPQMDLVAWLSRQLDHDERVAVACMNRNWARAALVEWLHRDAGVALAVANHMVLHDPARVLRQVAAYRRILAAHDRVLLRKGSGADYYVTALVCRTCGGVDATYDDGTLVRERVASWPCATVLDLASIYESRPGFDPSWTVE